MPDIDDIREYSREQAAGLLNMGVDALMRRVKAGLIEFRYDGYKYYFRGSAIRAFRESGKGKRRKT